MKTKLTLSVDRELIQFAQAQAKFNGQSVSGMFSAYLRNRQLQATRQATPNVAAMVGTLKSYSIDDSKQSIRSTYAKKYTS